MNILIYNDDGVSAESANALLNYFPKNTAFFVTGSELQNTEWIHDTQLFMMPGGRSVPYYEKLGKSGNDGIKQFVKNGGTYIGFCAGAYYACEHTIFAEGLPLELKLLGELNFFEGSAIGPAFFESEFAYQSESGARILDVVWKNEKTYAVYFNGGCYFHQNKLKNTDILACYVDNKKPAIIACHYGKGRAILSGVHPELSASTELLDELLNA